MPVAFELTAAETGARSIQIRQSVSPGLELAPDHGDERLSGELVALRRGRHTLPAPRLRCAGRLGLGAWYHRPGEATEVEVYPDLVSARRLALAAREGRVSESSRRARGPIGVGTDFESVRDWLPDDDVRHVNWRATQRLGRPMTNQYRLEQAREIMFVLDCGRLMASPLPGAKNRLDVALDALTAVALAADELSDHCGAIAFDSEVRRSLRPGRGGGAAVVRGLFDIQAQPLDSDYGLAFRRVAGGKRRLVFVLSDLFDEAAAAELIDAVPVLARRHAVIVATVTDPDLIGPVATPPQSITEVYRTAAALDLLDARSRAAALITRAGAQVLEAPPENFALACVRGYLSAKRRLRL